MYLVYNNECYFVFGSKLYVVTFRKLHLMDLDLIQSHMTTHVKIDMHQNVFN